jgi:heat shock protein 4
MSSKRPNVSVEDILSSVDDFESLKAVKLTSAQAMDTDAPNGSADKSKTRKVKKQVRKGDLSLVAGTASLDQASKNAAAEKENQMAMEDKLVKDTEDKKNELESYIYELREKIDGVYDEFSNEEEKEKIRAKCTETEVSLYHLYY